MVTLLVALFSFLIAGFVFLFWRLAARADARRCNGEWLKNFSVDSYAPLERLLDDRDWAFLASQPGYRPEIGRRLKVERRKIFRDYLHLLVTDFNQLIALGKLMVVYSSQDRPEFARSLFWQQLKFYVLVCAIYCQLALLPLGWNLVGVRDLVQAVKSMRDLVRQLTVSLPGQADPA